MTLDKNSKRAIIVVIAIMCLLTIAMIHACTHPDPYQLRPTDSVGMFDGATKLEITFDNKKYEITSEEVIDNIVSLCRTDWGDPQYEISKNKCDMIVVFYGARATLWVNTSNLSAFINDTKVQMNPEILDLIKSNMRPI